MNPPANLSGVGAAAARFLAAPRRMLIGAEWLDAVSGARIEVRDPANGEIVTTVPAADTKDVDLAVQQARSAFESREWGAARPVDRERWLLRLAELLDANAQELAEIETVDNGKPLVMSQRVDIPSAVDFLR